jgi:CubicO group peptidase (beta-lactamase class C family)
VKTTWLWLAPLFFSLPQPAVAQAVATELFPETLDAYVRGALRDWEIPGAAVAVVKDGRVVVVRGYGVRELGKSDLVDGNTIFDVASLTKSFTAAAVASLVDDGRMEWDDPVRRYLPTLEFPDPYLSANVTIRDLLCHRTGVRATNSAWYFTGVTRSQLPALVKSMELAAPFRTRLVYSNIGYTLVGLAAAAAAGKSWEDLVTQRLLVPLGMTRTTADFASAPTMGNVVSGHALISDVQRVTPRETTPRVTTGPAGAIQSSANDLATWMLFQLGDGTFRGQRILSTKTISEMHSPQIVVPTSEEFRVARQIRYFAAYGMGWQVFDYGGAPLLWHSGSGDGQSAYMAILPGLHLGILVLTNTSRVGVPFNGAVANRIIDYYLGVPTQDYAAELHHSWDKELQRQEAESRATVASRLQNAILSLPLRAYAGVYRDRLGLEVAVTLNDSSLWLQYGGGEVAHLAHWHHDIFRLEWETALHAAEWPAFIRFDISHVGRADGLHMQLFGDLIDAKRNPD